MVALMLLSGVLVGAAVGWVCWRRLAGHGHRYAEEAGLPVRSFAWVLPVMAVAVPLVGLGQLVRWGLAGSIGYAVLTVPLTVLSAIDMDVRRLPDRWTGPTFAAALVMVGLVAWWGGDRLGSAGSVSAGPAWDALGRAVLAAVVLGAVYLAMALFAPGGGMGLGDAKLAPSLGLLLGLQGWEEVLAGTFLAFLSGALWGVVQLVVLRAGRKATLAFGPHMVLGALLVLSSPSWAPFLG